MKLFYFVAFLLAATPFASQAWIARSASFVATVRHLRSGGCFVGASHSCGEQRRRQLLGQRNYAGRMISMMARGSNLGQYSGAESKRQARVSQLMRAEVADIVRRADLKGAKALPDTLRQKISIVDINMSPDLRSAKIFVSVFGEAVEKRQAYAWLVEHSKQFKHSLSQRLSNMKSVPDVYFKETDISAAVDVMATIDKLAAQREGRIGIFETGDPNDSDGMPRGVIDGVDFDFLSELVDLDIDEDSDDDSDYSMFARDDEAGDEEEDIEEWGDYDEDRDGDIGKWQ